MTYEEYLDSLSEEQLLAIQAGNYDALDEDTLVKLQSYRQPTPAQASPYNEDEMGISNDAHPEIGAWDRFVAKSFASSPDKQIGYLQQKHPQLKFKNYNGDVLARRDDENQWRRLDETDLTWKDGTDVLVDGAQAVAEGLGLAGVTALTGNPVAGVAASGGIGYVSELARQGIGSMLGVPDNIDQGAAGMSGAVSAGVPVVGKYVVKPAWGMVKKSAPVVGEWLSGIPREVLGNINVDRVAREQIEKTGVKQWVRDFRTKVNSGLKSSINDSAQQVGKAQGGGAVDVSGVINTLDNELKQLNPAQQKGFEWLKSEQLPNYVTPGQNTVDAKTAFNMKNDYYALGSGDLSPYGNTLKRDSINEAEKKLARTVSGATRDAIEQSAPDKAAYNAAANEHARRMGIIGDEGLKVLNNNGKTMKWLEGFGKPRTPTATAYRNQTFKPVSDLSGVDINQSARQYQSYNYFNDPSMLPQSWMAGGKGAGLGAGLGGAIGYYGIGGAAAGMAGGQAGMVAGAIATSPWAMMKAAQTGRIVEGAGNVFEKSAYGNGLIRGDKLIYNMSRD